MPITRVPVVHKFGIVSQSHQGELQKRSANPQHKDSDCNPKFGRCNINETLEEILYQINVETDELIIHDIEEKISVFVQKLKHQLSSVNPKTCWNIYEQCWKDLSTITNCCGPKVSKDSLVILKHSLSTAPLSRQAVKCLLDIGVTCMQSILPNENSHSTLKMTLKFQVCFLVVSRLHYHYMVKDLREMHSDQLEAMFLINKGLKKTLDFHADYPSNYALLNIIITMVSSICKEIELREKEFEDQNLSDKIEKTINGRDTTNGTMINKFYWNCLKLWKSISRHTSLEMNVLSELINGNFENVQSSQQDWLFNILSCYTLSECSKLNIEYLKIFIQLGRKSNYLTHVKKLSKVTKGVRTKHKDTEKLESTPSIFEKIDIFLNPTVTKDENNDPEIYSSRKDDIGSWSQSSLPEKYVKSAKKSAPSITHKWDWELLFVYINCLAKVCLHGLTIDIQKLALLGNDEVFGVVDYLQCTDGEHSWKIRCYTYQILYELYYHFQEDTVKDGLKSIIWNLLMKFQEKEKNIKVIKIMNGEVSEKSSNIITGSLFSLIATNMSIMISPPSSPHQKEKEEEKLNKPWKQNTKTTKGTIMKDDVTKIRTYHTTHGFQKNSYEKDSWYDVQKLVSIQYHKEVNENEEELEKLKIEMLKEGENRK